VTALSSIVSQVTMIWTAATTCVTGLVSSGEDAKPKLLRTIIYDYCDPASGESRYRKTRREYASGTKAFLIDPKGRGGSAPLLYGGERLADLRENQPVWIAEGEKKVERLRELGAVAVSGATGAKSKWLPAHAQLLRGLSVIFWPDSDAPGERYIANAAAAILAENPDANLRVVRPFSMAAKGEKGKDDCDWAATPQRLQRLSAMRRPGRHATSKMRRWRRPR
jgi:hypothetical protein